MTKVKSNVSKPVAKEKTLPATKTKKAAPGGKKAPKDKSKALPASEITPSVAKQAATLLQINNYNPLLVVGTANGELLLAVEQCLAGVKTMFIETNTEALSTITGLVADEQIRASLIEDTDNTKFDRIIADATTIDEDGLSLFLDSYFELLNENGRMVVILSSAKSNALQNFAKAYDGWIDTDSTHGLSFLCVNYKDQVG